MSNVASVVSFVQVMWIGFSGFVAHCLLRSLSTGFLGRHRLSPNLKRLWHMAECESSVASVGRWSGLRQRVFVEKEYCNLRVDDDQFLHILH